MLATERSERVSITTGKGTQLKLLKATPIALDHVYGVAVGDRPLGITTPDESATFALLSCLIHLGLLKGHPSGIFSQFDNIFCEVAMKSRAGAVFWHPPSVDLLSGSFQRPRPKGHPL